MYCSSNVIWVIKSRKMRVAGHVPCTEMRNGYKVWVGKSKEREHLEDLNKDKIHNIKMDVK